MYLNTKKILVISPEPWGNNFVSKHHYAVTLAKQGNRVYFLNPPSSSYSIQHTSYEHVHEVNYTPFLKGLRYLPEQVQRQLIRQKYEKLQRLTDCTFDVVWSFDNSVFYDFAALPGNVLKISHIVDLNQDFQTAKAASTADICFCTTDLIKEKLSIHNNHVYKIHHGYTHPFEEAKKIPLPGKYVTKAVYVGNLAFPYIDWKVIHQLVDQHQTIDFVFVGPDGKSNLSKNVYTNVDKEAVKAAHNAHFIGSVPHEQIPGILAQADVLLVVYKEEYHRDQASPHKFMEYLGSGKVMVATYTDEYKDKSALLAMCKKNTDYPSLFAQVIERLKEYNTFEKQEERKQFALANTYERQIDKITNLIKLHVRKSESFYHHACLQR